MWKGWKRIGLSVVSLGLAMTLVLGSVVPAKAAEERVVKIGVLAGLTGPQATNGVPLFHGTRDCILHTNDQGGIDGIKLEMEWQDTQGGIARGISSYKRLREAGIKMAVEYIATTLEVLTPNYAGDEIPVVWQGGPSVGMITKPAWILSYTPSAAWLLMWFAKWASDNWTEDRPLRLGVMIIDYSRTLEALECVDYGRKYLPEMGIEFVGYEVVPLLGTIDTSTEWLRLANKKPDWVFMAVFGSSEVTVIKDAARLGIMEKGIKLTGVYVFDEFIINVVGKAAEGWYIEKYYPSAIESDLPGMKALYEAAEKYSGWEPEKIPGLYISSWIPMMVGIEAIRLAIEKVGFENLTGRVIRDILFGIKDFDTGLIPPITTSEERPFLSSAQRMYQVQQGKIVPVDEWHDYALPPEVYIYMP